MKVLYIHQYFKTPKEPGGTRSYWFAKALINKGFKVVVLTSRSIQQKLIERENVDGIEVIYIKNSYDNSFGILRRIISFLKFMFISTYQAFIEKNISLIYTTSTPLTVGFPALICKWFKKNKYIFEVRDLWPEVPIQMGVIKNSLIRAILVKFEKVIYKNALHIVALSPGMKDGIVEKGCNIDKVTVIPNMSKVDEFFEREKNRELINRFKLKSEDFYAIYFGSMGIANGLDYIIDAAKFIQNKGYNNIKILFAGKGRMEKSLKLRCINENIRNIQFLGSFAMQEMSEVVNIADCSIITFQNLSILKTNSPNKLFDSLSAQKPIIVNSSGWTKNLVEENHCGVYVNPEKPEELAEVLIDWSKNPEKIETMGKNARKLAELKYDKKILSEIFVRLVLSKIEFI